MPWYFYIMRCRDGTFYSGITNDLANRFAKHNSGKGAKYTRSHRPVTLVYFEKFLGQKRAMMREWEVKTYPRAKKSSMIVTKSVEQIARGIFIKDNSVLLVHKKGASNTFLPGGHIEEGESPEEALRREIEEELGLKALVGRSLGAAVNSYTDEGKRKHEVNYCYDIEIEGLKPGQAPVSREDHLEFVWAGASVKRLKEYNLKPLGIRESVLRVSRRQGVKRDEST